MATDISIDQHFGRSGQEIITSFKKAHNLCKRSPMHPDNIATLRLLLQKHQDMARWQCSQVNSGQILLHTALEHDQPIEVIKLLVNAWPESVSHKSGLESLALHVACQYNSQIDVICFLIDQNHKALTHADFIGNLPIHVAATKEKISQPILELLVNAAPTTLMKCGSHNNTILHCLLLHYIVNVELVQCIAERWGGALKTLNDRHQTPLHKACQRQPASVILYLLRKFKPAARMVDKLGKFPLHHLFENYATPILSVATELIQAFPHALQHCDVYGNLPIHSTPAFSERWHSGIIKYMVDMVPYSLLAQNDFGYLPIHAACLTQNEEMVQWLASRVPLSLIYEDRNGKLPLHHLFLDDDYFEMTNARSIASMVHAFPPLICMGSFKHKPFYFAIRCGMTETGLFMANSYPNAIQMVVTVRGRNALHYACICGFTDMILQFVLLCPAAAAVTDDYNYLPLHYACEHHPLLPQHVIQNLVNAYPLASSKICPNLTFLGFNHIAQGHD